jgi:transposase
VETDPTRMCERFVDLPDINVLGVEGDHREPLVVHFESRRAVVGCPECGVVARVKDRPLVTLVDLPINGRPVSLVWHKRRFFCGDALCSMGSWTEQDTRVAFARHLTTDRAGRWLTRQIGRHGRSVAEIAEELGRAWHTVNDAPALRRSSHRRRAPHRRRRGAGTGRGALRARRPLPTPGLLDVHRRRGHRSTPRRRAWSQRAAPTQWLLARGAEWLSHVRYATLDLSGPYRSVFTKTVPQATQVADPFHLIKLANLKLDECRRRVQNELVGHYAGDLVKSGTHVLRFPRISGHGLCGQSDLRQC